METADQVIADLEQTLSEAGSSPKVVRTTDISATADVRARMAVQIDRTCEEMERTVNELSRFMGTLRDQMQKARSLSRVLRKEIPKAVQ